MPQQFKLSLPKPVALQVSDRPGSSQSSNMLDEGNSAGSHPPNGGRQHRRQVEKRPPSPEPIRRAGDVAGRTKAQARQRATSEATANHSWRAFRPPAPQAGGVLNHRQESPGPLRSHAEGAKGISEGHLMCQLS